MLVGLFADIHANREALSACLGHAERSGVDRFVFLGDYVGYGADPGWVIETISAYVERAGVAIAGNHDVAIESPEERMNPTAEEAIAWTRARLDAAQRAYLRALPVAVEEGDRLFVHASAARPRDWEYITGPRAALRSLRATTCRQTFCGHVHVPALYHATAAGSVGEFVPVAESEIPLLPRQQWLAVLGSVGQPRDGNPAACYALLDDTRNLLTYLRVLYDVDTAARKIRAAGLPPVLAARLERGY